MKQDTNVYIGQLSKITKQDSNRILKLSTRKEIEFRRKVKPFLGSFDKRKFNLEKHLKLDNNKDGNIFKNE